MLLSPAGWIMAIQSCMDSRTSICTNFRVQKYCSSDNIRSTKSSTKSLHWLPVNHHIAFKIAMLVFKGLHGKSPCYISEQLQYVSRQRHLRSNDQRLLVVPRTSCVLFGDRAFKTVGPVVWNSLPLYCISD